MQEKSHIETEVRIINIIISVLAVIAVIASVVALFIIPNYSEISKIFKSVEPIDKTKDFITVFSVGEADATIICSNGQTVLIDTGGSDFENELCSQIYNLGINKLDAVVVSHLHDDHTGGITKVVEQFTVDNLIVPSLESDEESAFMVKSAKNDILKSGGRVYTAVEGMVLNCGRFEITVLGYYGDLSDENDRSIFIMAKHENGNKVLFTGDAEIKAENRLIENNINFDCDILKVAHHGSDTSTNENFLKIATPEYAVISCGVDNQYSHPSEQLLKRLTDSGAQIKRTDLHGNITFHFYSNTSETNISSDRLIENE